VRADFGSHLAFMGLSFDVLELLDGAPFIHWMLMPMQQSAA
jgi:hypothetical protein